MHDAHTTSSSSSDAHQADEGGAVDLLALAAMGTG